MPDATSPLDATPPSTPNAALLATPDAAAPRGLAAALPEASHEEMDELQRRLSSAEAKAAGLAAAARAELAAEHQVRDDLGALHAEELQVKTKQVAELRAAFKKERQHNLLYEKILASKQAEVEALQQERDAGTAEGGVRASDRTVEAAKETGGRRAGSGSGAGHGELTATLEAATAGAAAASAEAAAAEAARAASSVALSASEAGLSASKAALLASNAVVTELREEVAVGAAVVRRLVADLSAAKWAIADLEGRVSSGRGAIAHSEAEVSAAKGVQVSRSQ